MKALASAFAGLSALSFALCVTAAIGAAQTTTAVSLAGGATVPVGRLKDTQSTGAGGAIGLVVGSADAPFGLRIDAGYDKLRSKTVNAAEIRGSRIISGTANLVFTFPGTLEKAYLLGGLGEYGMRSDSTGAKGSTRFGFDFGSGLSFPVAGRSGFLEARLQSISQNKAKPLRYLQLFLGLLL